MQTAGVAEIDEESNHHGLAALAGEKLDLLLFAFVQNGEILLLQIRHKAALVIGYGHRHDDLVHLHLNGRRGGRLVCVGRGGRHVRLLRRGRRGLPKRGRLPKQGNRNQGTKRVPQEHVGALF